MNFHVLGLKLFDSDQKVLVALSWTHGSYEQRLVVVDANTGMSMKDVAVGTLTNNSKKRYNVYSNSIDFLISQPKIAVIAYHHCSPNGKNNCLGGKLPDSDSIHEGRI